MRPCLICRQTEDHLTHTRPIGTAVALANRRVYNVHPYDPGERRHAAS